MGSLLTLVIRGKSERTYTSGNPPAGFVEGPSMHEVVKGEIDKHNKSQPQQPEKGDKHDKKTKYWLAERSFGDFSHTFTFPSHVVNVGFHDGTLSVVVPKVKKY
ncbi:putative heat shock protein 30 [Fusarium austroafricanum]|uniref:Putative heat shock protein 30 n=1 Tax=Fusarium austroafricanum TaxID=2364996 RepID=A0A8H4JLS6_9HYPO|nr:putative heat shock protein 30 [Fusarium austroafricanum]